MSSLVSAVIGALVVMYGLRRTIRFEKARDRAAQRIEVSRQIEAREADYRRHQRDRELAYLIEARREVSDLLVKLTMTQPKQHLVDHLLRLSVLVFPVDRDFSDRLNVLAHAKSGGSRLEALDPVDVRQELREWLGRGLDEYWQTRVPESLLGSGIRRDF